MTTLSKYLQTRILWLLLPPLWALFLFTIFWLYALPLPSLPMRWPSVWCLVCPGWL